MKWVILAILTVIVPYTIIRIVFAKPGPGHEPYADGMARETAHRLAEAGYRQLSLTAERPADQAQPGLGSPLPGAAAIRILPGGIPAELSSILLDLPLMPAKVFLAQAPSRAQADLPYSFTVQTEAGELSEQPAAKCEVFVGEKDIVIIPGYDELPGELQSRRTDIALRITLPPDLLDPGTYEVRVIGARASVAWTLLVEP